MPSKVELKLLKIIVYNPGKTADELKRLLWPKPCRCGKIEHYLNKLAKRGLIRQQTGYYEGTFVPTHAGEDALAGR